MSSSSSDEVNHDSSERDLISEEASKFDDQTQSPSETDSDDEELIVKTRYSPAPLSKHVCLPASTLKKTVASLAFNHSGTRFATGSNDSDVKIWNFATLDKHRPAPMSCTQPCGQYVIKALDYSHDDQLLLVISNSCQAQLIAKDGIHQSKLECPKGDQYLTDMTNTKGHTQELNDGCWNPKSSANFITCSNDATIRIWEMNGVSKQKTVIKARSPTSGMKAIPNVCRYSRDALSLVAGCNDGSILFWDTRRKFISTSNCIKNAHLKGSEITGLDFPHSGDLKICSRGDDETCKIWDLRKTREPIAVRRSIPTVNSQANCIYAPDDSSIVLGTHASDNPDLGSVLVLKTSNLEDESTHQDFPTGKVIRIAWQPKINHIGFTSQNGNMLLTYDDRLSMGGLLSDLGGAQVKRKKYQSQAHSQKLSNANIIAPHSLPLFRQDDAKSSFAKMRQDPKRSFKPEMPVTGQGHGGRVRPAGSTLSSYIARNIAKPVDIGGLDIRERILRHAEEAEANPIWVESSASTSKPAQGKVPSDEGQDKSKSK